MILIRRLPAEAIERPLAGREPRRVWTWLGLLTQGDGELEHHRPMIRPQPEVELQDDQQQDAAPGISATIDDLGTSMQRGGACHPFHARRESS